MNNNLTMIFPSINYQFWLNRWYQSVGTQSVYQSRHSIKYTKHKGSLLSCADEIEAITKTRVDSLDRESILRTLDLVFCWGGKSGRMFYFDKIVNSGRRMSARCHFNDEDSCSYAYYLTAAKLAQAGNPSSIDEFSKIYGMGFSFGSKCAYFWSVASKTRLIICDSKIAGVFGFTKPGALLKFYPYILLVEEFGAKAQVEFGTNDGSLVEKALFAFHNNYFRNDNSSFRQTGDERTVDFDESLRIGTMLFGRVD